MPDVAYRLETWVPVIWESVRLVAARAAAHTGDKPAPAQELAELLGVEVLAPDGRLIGQPGGSLFVLRGHEPPGRGVWWRFRPGRQPEATGRRFPVPAWEQDLAAFTDPGVAGVTVEEIPAGLWVRWPGRARCTDLARAIPVDPDSVALLVSRPGDPPLRSGDVRELVQAMPEALRERLTAIPYGDAPLGEARLGAVVSAAANQTLRMRTGVPLRLSRRTTQPVTIGRDGTPRWRPFARELAWRPYGGPRVLSWTVPSDRLLPAGPAQFLISPRWHVEVIEAGLWIRESDRVDGAAVVRHLPVSSRYCTVVVGACARDQGRPPWRAIAKLLQQLPSDAQQRVRVAVPEAAGQRLARSAAALTRYVPGDRPVYLLTEDGQVVLPDFRRDRRYRDSNRGQRAGDRASRGDVHRSREWDPGRWRDVPDADRYRSRDEPSRSEPGATPRPERPDIGRHTAPAERASVAPSAVPVLDIVVGHRRDDRPPRDERPADGATVHGLEPDTVWPDLSVDENPVDRTGRVAIDRFDARLGADVTD